MTAKETYQYSRGPIGLPSVLLALGWVAIWSLWPSAESSEGHTQRKRGRTEVSYGVVEESLYMSPLLFARSTRVGFLAPEEASADAELLDREPRSRNVRFLHVAPPVPDFGGLRRRVDDAVPLKQVDGYRPVWKDSAVFASVVSTNAVTVDVRGPLQGRGYQPGEITWPEGVAELPQLEVEVFVAIDAEGKVESVFLEEGSGSPVVDANVVRAMERGRAAADVSPVSGRVTVTMRRVDEGQD